MKYMVNGKSVTREEWLGCPAQAQERFTDMVESRIPPMSNTDREFLQGQGGCYDQFEGNELVGNFHRYQAKRHGVDTTGKLYLSGLAKYPGDPEAWVTGRGDVQRVCESRGWGCEGSVKVSARQAEVETPKGLATDIVDRLVERRIAEVPPGEKVDRALVREQVIEKHAPVGARREIG